MGQKATADSETILLTIADCSRLLQLGRTAVYEAARNPRDSYGQGDPRPSASSTELAVATPQQPPQADNKASINLGAQPSKLVRVEGTVAYSGTLTFGSGS